MQRRLIPYAANSLVMVLLVLLILTALNYLAFRNSTRIDLTKERLNSVSEQTMKVLKGLEKRNNRIEILAFFKEIGMGKKEFRNLIDLYKRASSKITVRFIDPDKEPGLAKHYGVREYGTVVILGGVQGGGEGDKGDKGTILGKGERKNVKIKLADPITGGIVKTSEQEITNAIIKLSKNVQKSVYFLSGHGERDIGNIGGSTGYGKARKALEDESYVTKELVLLRAGKVPLGDSLLVVAAPKKGLLFREIDAIKRFLDNGGAALFLLEPKSGEGLVELLRHYGVVVRNDVVIDPSSKLVGGGDIAPIVATYPVSDITKDFRFATIFPYARSVGVSDVDGFHSQVIAKTSEYSWGETDLELFTQGTAELGPKDIKGPLGVAATSEKPGGARIAVFGSADLASNRFFDFSGNSDLFLNTVNWLMRDEDMISIRPRVAKEGKLNLTSRDQNLFFVATVVLVPLIVLISGVVVWFRRRNR